MARLVPAVEIAHDEDFIGFRGPNGEVGTVNGVGPHGMGPELLVEPMVVPFVEKVKVLIGKPGYVVAHGLNTRCFIGALSALFSFFLCHEHLWWLLLSSSLILELPKATPTLLHLRLSLLHSSTA
jgi:hypothetical protein